MTTAPTFDVSSVTSTIDAIPIAEIGGALLAVAALAMGFKWLKGMIFG